MSHQCIENHNNNSYSYLDRTKKNNNICKVRKFLNYTIHEALWPKRQVSRGGELLAKCKFTVKYNTKVFELIYSFQNRTIGYIIMLIIILF